MREDDALAQAAPVPAFHSLADLGLVDAPPEAAYDALSRMATRSFGTPVALISIIDEANDRQFFKSQIGLATPWAERRQTPLSHSFCKHVKSSGLPLIVSDSRRDPLVCDNPAITDLNVVAYLGVPIRGPCGSPLGALCVIDDKPRDWTEQDVALLNDLALCVRDEIQLRAELRNNERLVDNLQEKHMRLTRYSALREMIVLAFMAPDLTPEQRFQALLKEGAKALGMHSGAIARLAGPQAIPVFAAHADGADTALPPLGEGGALFSGLTNGQSMLTVDDLASSPLAGRRNLFGDVPGAVIAAPIVLGRHLSGVLEFTSPAPRDSGFSDEDLSMFSIIAMFAAAHLSMHGQINALKRSETALIGQLLDARAVQQLATFS